jgi:hypothetical protein
MDGYGPTVVEGQGLEEKAGVVGHPFLRWVPLQRCNRLLVATCLHNQMPVLAWQTIPTKRSKEREGGKRHQACQ